MNSMIKCIVVVLLTAILAACSILMIGPQIVIIVPVAIVVGIVFAIRRCQDVHWSRCADFV